MNTTVLAYLLLLLTLVSYYFAKRLYQQFPYLLLSPAFFVPIVLVTGMVYFHIPYTTYMQESHWLVWMLGPATVAFAIPIYEYRNIIREYLFSISLGVFAGMLAGILSAFYLARLFKFDDATTYSLMSRSISTPFAMELTEHVGGSVELVILFTMMTGVAGMLCGDLVLIALKLKSHFAHGAALGNAAHGFGTTKAYMRHREEGVVASLTMVLAGVFMVLAGPFLIRLILRLTG